MKTILVTGGAGYIGSHTAKALSQAGYNPLVYDNLSRGNRWAVKWGDLIEADLGDREALVSTMRRHRVQAVLHFAAFAYVGESMLQPELYFHNNVVKSLTLLDAMREAGVARLVFSSTCAVYGTPEYVPITEATRPAPINPYGESKLMIEQALRWHGAIHGLSWMALRYFNACGADPAGEIGEAHDPEPHLIPLILDAALGRRPAITVFGNDYPTQDGTCIRDYIHVSDLADAHVLALRHLEQGGESRPLNLGTGRGHSVLEMIQAAQHSTGLSVPVHIAARRPGDPATLVADATLACAMLGWRPYYNHAQDMIDTAWAWHRSRTSAGG